MSKTKDDAVNGRDRLECSSNEGNMSSPINPTQGVTGAEAPSRTSAAAEVAASSAVRGVVGGTRPASVDSSVSLEAVPATPPQEVLEQMAEAGQRYEALSAQGQELHFTRDADGNVATLEVRGAGGEVLKSLSLAEAVDLAAGVQPQ
jgi:hypothetical protein